MNAKPPDPIRPADDAARALARRLISEARTGALAVLAGPEHPFVSRVAVGALSGRPLILVSRLSQHTTALTIRPACALLLGEPGPKGDPLTHPRLTLQGRVEAVDKGPHRDLWLAHHPKAAVYFDFADFIMFRILPDAVFLNAGFGQAYTVSPADLAGA
jgi:hypothetical protein